ncbi:hypothetical protein NLG97_g7542 [Lecanicillium saksenae]|uniref:Uncharacterized protein n=1 Tax=Lecanicillium saksenae TaxID=468837 RepID=A0ACC1QQC9_9HYPO|nr:hypothetical protein NLG97_g7542 [Lecanicillium saksenae]
MDRLNELLLNARDRLGCSGLRNLKDLAQMRQETLEKRFANAQHTLTVRNTLSIYTAWLWEKAFHIAPKDLHIIMEKWCVYLWGIGCTREMARVAWINAQTMFAPHSVKRGAPQASLHMKIGSSITNQFPTAPIVKRKLAVLEERACSDERAVDKKHCMNASSPATKRHKASHVPQGISGSPFRQPVPGFPQPVPLMRRDYFTKSPEQRETNSLQDAARRAREEYHATWRNDGFCFDFGQNPPRAVGGGSYWSPRRGLVTAHEQRATTQPSASTQRHQTPIKIEDRSPTPPPRVISVGRSQSPAPPPSVPSQLQKQTQKPSWQINSVQNQLIQQAKMPAAQIKVPVTAKAVQDLARETSSATVGQSGSAKFGAIIYEASKKPTHSFTNWSEAEIGRLSPWEEDDDAEIPKQPAAKAMETKQASAPLPLRPSPVRQHIVNTSVKNKPLSQFGAPEGVCKPLNKENDNPNKAYVPSALKVPGQQNVQHPQPRVQQQYCMPQNPPQFTGPQGVSGSNVVRIAPYPRMHASPLPQQPILLQGQSLDKPLGEYHPRVTHLFRRRPNVWVHQTNRPVALDSWGNFTDMSQPQEYWAWEEYDPFNPLV